MHNTTAIMRSGGILSLDSAEPIQIDTAFRVGQYDCVYAYVTGTSYDIVAPSFDATVVIKEINDRPIIHVSDPNNVISSDLIDSNGCVKSMESDVNSWRLFTCAIVRCSAKHSICFIAMDIASKKCFNSMINWIAAVDTFVGRGKKFLPIVSCENSSGERVVAVAYFDNPFSNVQFTNKQFKDLLTTDKVCHIQHDGEFDSWVPRISDDRYSQYCEYHDILYSTVFIYDPDVENHDSISALNRCKDIFVISMHPFYVIFGLRDEVLKKMRLLSWSMSESPIKESDFAITKAIAPNTDERKLAYMQKYSVSPGDWHMECERLKVLFAVSTEEEVLDHISDLM